MRIYPPEAQLHLWWVGWLDVSEDSFLTCSSSPLPPRESALPGCEQCLSLVRRLDGVSPSTEHRWPGESLKGETPSSHLRVLPRVPDPLPVAISLHLH
jgi:hypothetical protein